MIKLTPNIYKNIKWALAPQNKVDTVHMSPTLNTLSDDPQTTVTPVTTVAINDSSQTLPISNSFVPTHLRTMTNSRDLWFENRECAKARVECVMASGTRTIHVDHAIVGMPFVSLSLRGHSYALSRGQSTYTTYPATADVTNPYYSITQWIIDNADTYNDNSMMNDYSTYTINMNPWIRKVVPAEVTGVMELNLPTYADIKTTWVDPDQGGIINRYGALMSDWIDNNTFDTSAPYITMFPVNPSGSDPASVLQCAIRMQDLSIGFTCSIEKLTDFDFKVAWTAPVRFSYLAASQQYGPAAGEYSLDNYAYTDIVDAVDIVLDSYVLNDEQVSVGYSLNAAGGMTTNVKNVYPLRLEGNEAFTLDSTYVGKSGRWCDILANNILKDCALGEFVVQCEVSAKWALRNDVRINTPMQIYLLDGTYIVDMRSGGTSAATFYVKNIRKVFDNNKFMYELKLSTKGG